MQDLRDVWADRREFLHNFIMPVQNFGGLAKKILGAKNMQNLAWFLATSKFNGEYLRNSWRQNQTNIILSIAILPALCKISLVQFGSVTLGDLDVKLYPPKAPFSEDHISAPSGCCAPNFYTR